MVIKKIFLLIFLVSISINACSEQKNKDFDAMCSLFQDVMKLNLKPQARLAYINKHFDSRVNSKDVKEAYELIFQVNANQRYQVFKQSVESSSGQKWTCPALDEFFK